MTKIYLAHPKSRRKEIKKFERKLKKAGFEVVNAFDLNPWEKAWEQAKETQKNMRIVAMKLVDFDLDLIEECDILIAFYPEVHGQATDIEIYHAAANRGMNVFVLTTLVHPFYLVYALPFKTEKTLLKFLEKRYG